MTKWIFIVALVAVVAGTLGFVVMVGAIAIIAEATFYLLLGALVLLAAPALRRRRK